jgi:hypothetical protein
VELLLPKSLNEAIQVALVEHPGVVSAAKIYSWGYAGEISPVSGSTTGSSDDAASLRRRTFDCLSR